MTQAAPVPPRDDCASDAPTGTPDWYTPANPEREPRSPQLPAQVGGDPRRNGERLTDGARSPGAS